MRQWRLDEIVNDLRKARNLPTLAEREEALEIINRQAWSPSYAEVKEELGLRGKQTISSWVLKGRTRKESKNRSCEEDE